MATLSIASKANQATSVPALLVASYANQSNPNALVDIKFEEADTLKSKKGTSVEFVVVNDAPVYGSENAVSRLIEAHPFLQVHGKHKAPVGYVFSNLVT